MSCDIEATIDQRPINATIEQNLFDVTVDGAIIAMDLADGDYGDIAVSNNGATMTIENMGENATVTTGTYVSKVNQDLLIKVRKANAGTITKGQAVYIVGSTGNHLTVELARADAEVTSAYTIGIAATTITNTTDGFVIQNGRLTGLSTLPTANFADGNALYLSETTAGGYRVGIPEAPNHGVFLGFVIRANNGNAGELDVRIDNYQELEELSDVYVTGSNVNDFLVKKATRWENTTPANVKTILAINNVDNTSDANKPISTATQTVLNAKVNKSGDTMTGALVNSTNGAVSTPPMSLTGSWYSGGTSTTTKPQLLIEPSGTTSTNWSTAGTGLGVNAASGFTGNLLDLQVNESSIAKLSSVQGLTLNTPSNVPVSATSYGLSINSPLTKTYPTTANFASYPAYYANLELGTSQTYDTTTGFNFVYGDYRNYTKSAGTTSDIERLNFTGFRQDFTWNDANTCKQYIGITDNFNYNGKDANGRISSSFNCISVFLTCPSSSTQTITNITVRDALRILASNANSTYTITNTTAPNLLITGSGANSIVNITNYSFFSNNINWNCNLTGAGSSATITNMFGLRLNPPTNTTGLTITNNWGIYSGWSLAKNYFAGDVGIGTTTPNAKLDVNGQIRTAAPTGGTAANWRLGTVATVSPTSPNRTIEVDIGGTIYYIHAKTTNN